MALQWRQPPNALKAAKTLGETLITLALNYASPIIKYFICNASIQSNPNLAHESGMVAGLFQQGRIGFLHRSDRHRRFFKRVTMRPPILAGQDTGPGGGADGRCAKCVIEPKPLSRQSIDVGCVDN